ncbi:ethanolamine ammonia-lyase small subunit [Angulomicrobium tetraedrale]|uniref:Ethanolamine ammonia-lyase small subunit n=1 Tax=Ancylobacter tetraedralis TaxID=217068 RepID=A0A839Z9A0_9HYPH|nr:ethanolamine ammonia-lyase subunit EutC [Ancylobacter tetraedralis]MBB3771358.1 ethanolamine ammonia-lyase small subunit [Ancylobacter tetraedralis]
MSRPEMEVEPANDPVPPADHVIEGGEYRIEDSWSRLAGITPARIALGRVGAGLPTREVLRFALAHAQARDAVHAPFDSARMAGEIAGLGFETLELASAAPARDAYLRRPDLGRRLSDASRAVLRAGEFDPVDLAIVVADGLSSTAIHAQAVPFLTAFQARIAAAGWRVAPVVIASQARVALGDEVGEALRAAAVVVLIGERPGLSSPDSLGLYLTFAPRAGRTDAERNCISNVRGEGLSHDQAAFKLAWLLEQALARQLTGVSLKDESDLLLVNGQPPVPRLG